MNRITKSEFRCNNGEAVSKKSNTKASLGLLKATIALSLLFVFIGVKAQNPCANSTLAITVNKTNETAKGMCNASAYVTVTGGRPLVYLWSNLQTTPQVGKLCSGAYSVTVKDSMGCTKTATFTILTDTIKLPPNPCANSTLAITVNKTNETAKGMCNASAYVTVTGGRPLGYLWSNLQTTPQVGKLCSGAYSVTVKDSMGCTKTATFTILTDTIKLPPNPCANSTLAVSIKAPMVLSNCSGRLDAIATGGTAPYTYLWNTNYRTKTLMQVCPGVYSVRVIDAKGCIAKNYTIIKADSLKRLPLDLGIKSIQASDINKCDGSAAVFVRGGMPPYTYLYSNGAKTEQADSLCAGVYMVSVTDAKGQRDSLRFVVAAIKDVHVDSTRKALKDSILRAELRNKVINNCIITATLMDSVRLAKYFLLTRDSINVEWKIYKNGIVTVINSKYKVDSSGVYRFVLQIVCVATKKAEAAIDYLEATGDVYVDVNADLTSIAENKNATHTQVFPNPFNSTINIKLDKNAIYTISLFDLTGKQVLQNMQMKGNTEEIINLQNLQSGYYFMKVTSEENVEYIKLIKE